MIQIRELAIGLGLGKAVVNGNYVPRLSADVGIGYKIMRRIEQAILFVVLLILAILTVQSFSVSRHIISLDNQLDSQSHADIQLIEARVIVLEKDMQRFKGRDDVTTQLAPLLNDLKKELENVRTLQNNP